MATWPEAEVGNPAILSPFHNASIGVLLGNMGGTLANAVGTITWPTANKAFVYPFRVRNRPFVAKQAFVLNGSAVSGNVDVGVYDSRGNLIVSTGATAQAGTSVVQLLDITDTTLQPGRYLLALSVSNTTARVARASNVPFQTLALNGCWVMTSAHPLPSTLTLATPDTAYVPVFGISSLTV